MRSKLVKRQLIAFVIVTVAAVSILGVTYLRIPAKLGMGRYQITVALPDASGLYDGAPVDFRGSEVGQVTAVTLTSTGVVAKLSLEKGTAVPRSSKAEVTDGSVIGEPYLNLVYTTGDRTAFTAGDRIPASRVTLPTSTAQLFTQANALLSTLPTQDLTTTIDQAYQALAGHEDDLTGLLDSSTQLTDSAAKAEGSTKDLITKLQPVLATQADLRAQIDAAATGLDTVTATLAKADPTVRALIDRAAPAAAQLQDIFTALNTDLQPLLIATGQFGDVLNVYLPALKHILIVLPALIEANKAVQHYDPTTNYGESGLSFKVQVNDPPTCSTGFPEAGHQRSPQDTSEKDLPADSYCKLPSDSPLIVRGARNFPCPNDPAKRGATAAACGLDFDPLEVAADNAAAAAQAKAASK